MDGVLEGRLALVLDGSRTDPTECAAQTMLVGLLDTGDGYQEPLCGSGGHALRLQGYAIGCPVRSGSCAVMGRVTSAESG